MRMDQYIQDYISNRLSEKQRQDFVALLEKDADLERKFNEHKALQNAFKLHEAERLKNILKAHENKKSPKKFYTSKPVIYSIAALFLLLVGMTVYFNLSQQDLYNQFYDTYPNVYQPIVRGNDKSDLTQAFVFYENENFSKANEMFAALLNQEYDPNVDFYYGLSLMELGNVEEAINRFNGVQQNDQFQFKSELLWFQALGLSKIEDYENALILLNQLADFDKNYMFEKRVELQDALQSKL